MKRSTAMAVLATAAILIAAGQLPRLAFPPAAGAWRERAAHELERAGRNLRESPAAIARALRPAPPPSRPAKAQAVARTHAGGPAAALDVRGLLGRLRVPSGSGLRLVLVLALAGLVVLAAVAWRHARDRRGRVFQMARRGLPATRIARRARVAQDAVLTLLTPGLGTRR